MKKTFRKAASAVRLSLPVAFSLTASPVHCGQFPDIEHHFAIHNRSFNAEWLSILSSQGVLLSRENLDKLRDHQGSEVRIIVLAVSAHAAAPGGLLLCFC